MVCKDRRKNEDYRHLTYLVSEVKQGRKTPRGVMYYQLTLARCLDHNGKHPAHLPNYFLIS